MTLAVGPEGGDGAPNGAPPSGRSLRSGHGSRGRTLKNKRDGEVRGVLPRNYRDGERQSWLGVFAFVGGPEPIYGTTSSSAPAFTGTQAWGAAFGDPPVGQGDPGVKQGAFLPGLPPFIWSRRGDHGPNGNGPNGNGPNGNGPNGNGPNGNGPNGYVWVIVWVVGPDSPGLTGTHRDSPAGVSPWAQRQTGRAAAEPRHGGAALWSLMARHGSRGRTLRNKRDGEVRGVHLRTKGGWRRSTGTRSRAAGSQVRNDRRLRCLPLLLNGVASKRQRLR